MTLFLALVLGAVQGLTEFIPVSSSGHLEIIQQLFGSRGADFHTFVELVNIGTLLALVVYYRKRIVEILRDIFVKRDLRFALNVIITCIPAGLAGLILAGLIEDLPFFSSLATIGVGLLVVGILMIVADSLPHFSTIRDEKKLSRWRAFGIGCAQIFALIPGVSRSGSTILAGRVMGMDNKSAATYSFLVSIPLMCGVVLKTFLSSSDRAYFMDNLGLLAWSNLMAFLFGMVALYTVFRILQRPGSLKYFGYYRVVLSAVVLGIALSFAV